MTEKQKRFCEEYLIDLNATQAAIRSGYSVHSANQIGNDNMAKACIRACIDKALAERSKRTGINADRVLQEIAKLALVNPIDLMNLGEATVKDDANRDDTAAIQSVRVKITPSEDGNIVEREVKLTDKTKNLELLGRHLGLFTDNLNITGDVGVEIVNDIPKNES